MLALAGLAALALTAVAGAGSASASRLCSTKTSPCSGTIYGIEQMLNMQLKTGTTATLVTGFATVTCSSATMKGKITAAGGPASLVTGEITNYSLGGCQTGGGTPCGATATTLPYHFAFHYTSGGNGTLTVQAGAGGEDPGFTMVCGTLINCKFTNLLMSHGVTGGSPAIVTASAIPMARTGAPCPPATPTWSVQYEVTEPGSLFVSAS